MSIRKGAMMLRADAEALAKHSITKSAFDWYPQGARMLVLKERVKEKVGSIFISENAQGLQQVGVGWIIGVGPRVGQPMPPGTIGGVECDEPEDMLGQRIVMGMVAGKVVRFTQLDTDYESDFIVLAPIDPWLIWYGDSEDDEDDEEAYKLSKQGQEDAAGEQLKADRELAIRKRELSQA